MGSVLGLGMVITFRDQVSAGLDRVRERLQSLRGVGEEAIRSFDAGAKQMLSGVGMMYAGARTLGAVFGNQSVAVAAGFEQAMARVQAVSGATGSAFEALSDQARELGATTQFTASEAAAAQESLARAGFRSNEIVAGMPGLLNMAAAEGMGIAQAADIAASAIRGFGYEASEAARVADVLAKASASSNTNIAELGEGLKYVAPVAKGLGMEIEQVSAMMGIMANAGIKGSMGGTALRGSLLRLSKPPKEAAEALAALKVQAKDSAGNLLPLPVIMQNLSDKMAGMGEADKTGFLAKIFGTEASAGMLALMNAPDELARLTDELKNANGAAAQMADTMNGTAQGAEKRLASAVEGLRISIGNALLPVYTWLTNAMGSLIGWITRFTDSFPGLMKVIGTAVGGFAALAAAALTFGGAMMMISGALKVWPLLSALTRTMMANTWLNVTRIAAAVRTGFVPAIRLLGTRTLEAARGLGTLIAAHPLLVGAAVAAFAAWRTNLFGIRDLCTAVVEGLKMAFGAGADGVVEVSRETADALIKAGIWDWAITVGRVFYRLREFCAGVAEGFSAALSAMRGGLEWLINTAGEIFPPLIDGGRELLEWLGVLTPISESSVDTWEQWGVVIGNVAVAVGAVITAFQAARVITAICEGIAGGIGLLTMHPMLAGIGLVIAAAYLLWQHWDEISAAIGGAVEWLGEQWGKFCDLMKEQFAGVYSAVRGVVDKVMGVLRPVIDSVRWLLEKAGLIDPAIPDPAQDMAEKSPARRIREAAGYVFDERGNIVYDPTDGMSAENAEKLMRSARASVEGSAPAAAPLAQAAATQAAAAGTATAAAIGDNPAPVKVDLKSRVDVQPTVAPIVLDGEKIGEVVTEYQARQSMREGAAVVQ